MSLGDPFSPMWLKLPDPCLRRGMRLIPSRPPLPGTKEGAPRRLLPRLIPRDTFHAMMGRIRSLSQVGDSAFLPGSIVYLDLLWQNPKSDDSAVITKTRSLPFYLASLRRSRRCLKTATCQNRGLQGRTEYRQVMGAGVHSGGA